MESHRIRMNDLEVELVCASLAARLAMTTGKRREAIERLLRRLEDGGAGNPRWRFEPTRRPA